MLPSIGHRDDHESEHQYQDAANKKEKTVKEGFIGKCHSRARLAGSTPPGFHLMPVCAKEDIQQSMMQLPVGSEPVRSQADKYSWSGPVHMSVVNETGW